MALAAVSVTPNAYPISSPANNGTSLTYIQRNVSGRVSPAHRPRMAEAQKWCARNTETCDCRAECSLPLRTVANHDGVTRQGVL